MGCIELRGWRAESLPRVLANAWEAAADNRPSSAEYWFADARKIVATARPLKLVDGTTVHH